MKKRLGRMESEKQEFMGIIRKKQRTIYNVGSAM